MAKSLTKDEKIFAKKFIRTFDIKKASVGLQTRPLTFATRMEDVDSMLYKHLHEITDFTRTANKFFNKDVVLKGLIEIFLMDKTSTAKLQAARLLLNISSDSKDPKAQVDNVINLLEEKQKRAS